jgi:predicted branched-subunit amino acid permease
VRQAAFEEALDITPMVVGILPLAIAIGATIGPSTLSTAQGVVSAAAILAGAAQLNTIELLDGGAATPVAIASGLMINARILLYSASIAPWFREEPLRRRLLLAIPVIDQMHFTCIPRFERGDLDRRGRRAYYVGAATWLVGAWVATQTIAIATASQAPEWLGFNIAAPLALIGLLAKATVDRRTQIAGAVAGLITVVGVGLPFHSNMLVAIVAGIAVAAIGTTTEEVS